MTKYRMIALILACLLFLCACQPTVSEPTTVPMTTAPLSQEPSEPDITQDVTPGYENTYSIALPISIETIHPVEESDAQYQLTYQTMHLILPDRDVADKVIIDFMQRIEEAKSDAAELMISLEDTQQSDADWSYRILYDPTRIDQGVLSLYGGIVSLTDAMHANYKCVSANYDMVTGDVLTLGSILYHADSKEDLCSLVVSELEQLDGVMLYDDFAISVADRFARDESNDEAFFFNSTGLCFYFSPYEIAPYSSGTIVVEIPYGNLLGIIGDAFFPIERPNANGTLSVCSFEQADLASYEQFAELVMVPNATKILFTTADIVQNIRIRYLTWDPSGSYYAQATTVFASNTLSPKDAILLEAELDPVRPNYSITYTRDGQDYLLYLIQSEDGTISMTSHYMPNE